MHKVGERFTQETCQVQPILCVDSREPDPSPWEQYFNLPSCRATLPLGDYSLLGCHEWVCIERKALDDLIGCLCGSRERFTKELKAAARIPTFAVIVEGKYSDLLLGNYRSQMHPGSAWESVIALQQRFGIPFHFAENAEIAARLCESILLRWFREHQKAVETCMKAARSIAHDQR